MPRGHATVAIVGSATLKGKELKEVLEQRKFPAEIKLIDDDESLGKLDSIANEATFVLSMIPEHVEGVDLLFLASDAAFTQKTWEVAKGSKAAIVDLSGAIEGLPVWSPWLAVETRNLDEVPERVQIAHPAATVLGLILLRSARAGRVTRSVVTLLEPASERGRLGMDELHNQTINLLSFQPLPTAIFDTQVAFNVLGRYGAEAKDGLDAAERRILANLADITAKKVAVPSLMLLHAPVFHAYTFSMYIEFENLIAEGDLARILAGEHVSISRLMEDAPTNVNAAGSDEIRLTLRRDAEQEKGFWIWGAADNLRITAISAADCAVQRLALQPLGKRADQ